MSNNNVIIIPVYKITLTNFELISLCQCLKVLNKYDIYVVTYKELDLNIILNVFQKYNVICHFKIFDKSYFESISGYNHLMLSLDFYTRFRKYKYMLIYQLDAYVFRDELDYWCKKGYDYIGAPWFEEYGTFEDGKKLWKVGNGGFSIRKIDSFIRLISFKGPILKPYIIFKSIDLKKSTNLLRIISFSIAKCFGYKNNISYLIRQNEENEDCFWTLTFEHSWVKIKIAPLDLAIEFAFEKSPAYLFNQKNYKLPFGCHAWEKYDYYNFWRLYIEEF